MARTGIQNIEALFMTKEELDKIRNAYIKVYGDRWKEYFVKHYWWVHDETEKRSKISRI